MTTDIAGESSRNGKYPVWFKILAGIFLILQVSLIILTFSKNEAKSPLLSKKGESRKIPVAAYNAGFKKLEDSLEVPGIIDSWATVRISAEVSGRIEFIGASEGDKLALGQIILKIDDRTYESEFRKAEAERERAKLHFERCRKLQETKSISEKEFEEAKNLLGQATAEAEIKKTELERCEIRSPIEGFLDDRPVELGEYLQPGTQVATIVQIDKVKVNFSISEKDIHCVKSGEKMPFKVDSLPDRYFEGKLGFISKSAEKSSLSFNAELEVENRELLFLPGMIARVKLVRGYIDGVTVVPLIAIMPKYEGLYVYVCDANSRARLREIKIGMISGEYATVLSGISPGEDIVVEGQRLLNENVELNAVRKISE